MLWKIIIALMSFIIAISFYCMCRVAGESDRAMEEELERRNTYKN